MKAFFYNRGTCTRVKLYGLDVINLFEVNGWEIVKEEEQADYIFINTCSFLESKSSSFLNFLRDVNSHKSNKQKLVVIGCLGGTHRDDIISINKKILIFKRDILEIKDYFKFTKMPKSKVMNVEDKLPIKKELLYLFNKYILRSKHIEYRLKRNRVCYLQISVGCRGKCSYCSEKFITHLKSREINEIVDSVYDGISRGYKLFGLNSDDASCYGLDINSSLEELLSKLVAIDEDIYFSIPEFNPNGLTDNVVELLKDKKFLYITVPIQSGSNRILKLMKRPYNIEKVKSQIMKLKSINKKIKINTHVIVGFPSETEDDFNETKELLTSGLFDRVKVFMYNERPNTEALDIEPKVFQEEKIKRRDILLKTMKHVNLKHFSLVNIILNKEQLK